MATLWRRPALALAVDDRKPHMFGLWLDGLVYEISADNLGGILPRSFHLGARQGGSVGERPFAKPNGLSDRSGLIRKTLPRCSAAVSHRYRDCHFFAPRLSYATRQRRNRWHCK